ncbi:Lanthionine synthetase C-like protein [Nonomuraea solani]|uniref:Lanthionine synthetase C-like protein n=1 Tax=Nonomuraea solani TaxID=1144553 RepID=A0A1H6CRZ2_9ACTN|nr:lanthionine synthetase C family protein [Nonomuraea solani]SEG75547.1 Lanthionine synthetase C-like protein [Nonomuraea solani]
MQDTASRVARLVVDPVRREEALDRLVRTTLKPEIAGWSPESLSRGGAGLALLCAALDEARPGEGWDARAHEFLAGGLAVAGAPDGPLSLFSGRVGYAAAVWACGRGGTRYQALTDELDAAMLPLMRTVAERLPPGPHYYDVVYGISGWVGYLTVRERTPAVDAVCSAVAAALIRLLSPRGIADLGYLLEPGRPVVDLGLAHGVGGVLAALSLLHRRTPDPDAAAAIRWGAEFLMRHVLDGMWPARVDLDPRPDDGKRSGGGSWCHGDAGVARALYLAGQALDLSWIRDFAVDAARLRCATPVPVPSPNLCHGLAGRWLLTAAFAEDTGDPVFRTAADGHAAELLGRFRPRSPLGYADVEADGRQVDNPGLLKGAAGVALTLLATEGKGVPGWARLLLV